MSLHAYIRRKITKNYLKIIIIEQKISIKGAFFDYPPIIPNNPLASLASFCFSLASFAAHFIHIGTPMLIQRATNADTKIIQNAIHGLMKHLGLFPPIVFHSGNDSDQFVHHQTHLATDGRTAIFLAFRVLVLHSILICPAAQLHMSVLRY